MRNQPIDASQRRGRDSRDGMKVVTTSLSSSEARSSKKYRKSWASWAMDNNNEVDIRVISKAKLAAVPPRQLACIEHVNCASHVVKVTCCSNPEKRGPCV